MLVLAKQIQNRAASAVANIPQTTLFGWEDDIENLSDLARLKLVMEHLPDGTLMAKLEKERALIGDCDRRNLGLSVRQVRLTVLQEACLGYTYHRPQARSR